jgi:hypothetical protein
MQFFLKKILLLFGMAAATTGFAQNQWIGQLSISDFDCENQTACYILGIKGVESEAWALGDQNYRFFYDAENISIASVTSLLPEALYSSAQLDEVLELTGQNQEIYSPLDNIDDNLGFLDFNIVSYAKQFPAAAKQISNENFQPIAEICLEVSAEMMQNTGEEYAMNILFSRPLTAGQITNQFSVISEIDVPNHTKATSSVGFLDITYDVGLDEQLGQICELLNDTKEETILNQSRLTLFPNPYMIGEVLTYQSEFLSQSAHNITIYDANAKVIKQITNLPAGNQQIKIQDQLVAGIYLFHVQSGQHQFMETLIVVKK